MKERLKVLIIGASSDGVDQRLQPLEDSGFELEHRLVKTNTGLAAALDETGWQLVLSDYTLPGLDGLAALKIVQARAGDVPFIFISDSLSVAQAVGAVKAGAHDVLEEGQVSQLPSVVRRELRAAALRVQERQSVDLMRMLGGVLESSAHAVVLTDPDGVIQWVNRAFIRLTGYTANEVLGNQPRLLNSGRHSPEFYQSMWQTIRAGGVWHGDLINKRKDGSLYPEEMTIAPVADESGAITHFIAIKQDVTERKRIQTSLELAQQRTLNILESITDGFFSLDAEYRVTYINDQGARLVGKSREALLHRSLWESFPEAVGSPFHKAYERALKEKVAVTTEAFYAPLKAWFDVRAFPSKDGLSVFYRDVTEQKLSAEALQRAHAQLEVCVEERTTELRQTVALLKESEERYRILFDSAPLGIARSDYHGCFLDANRGLCELLGVTQSELNSSPAREFYANPSEWKRLVSAARRGGDVGEFETEMRTRAGRVFPALLQIRRMNLRGKSSLMLIVQDISQRKQAETRMQSVSRLLELFATRTSRGDYLESTVALLKQWCSCHAAGIRLLDQNDHLPFAASSGFTKRFVNREGQLDLKSQSCACTRLLLAAHARSPAPEKSAHHSMPGNESATLKGRSGKDLPPAAATPCLGSDFKSVLQIPLQWHGRLLGSIHLADRRPGHFTAAMVEFLNSLAPVIGEALQRFRIEESLLDSEERFRSMFEKHDTIMLLSEPKSGKLVDVNPAAVSFYGRTREVMQSLTLQDLGVELPDSISVSGGLDGEDALPRFESATRLADGSERIVEVYSSSFVTHHRQLLFSIMHDVTERKRLQKQIVEAGEVERQRVGRDLHDSVGGYLTGLALMAKALARTLSQRSAPEGCVAEEIVTGLNDAIGRTRAIAHGLCPVGGGEFAIVGGLRQLIADVRQRTGVSCQLKVDAGINVGDTVASNLFRMVEEAVQNALRHARPKRLEIRLRRSGKGVLLSVWNDGKPLDRDFNSKKGLGLQTMNHRSETIGARFDIRSADGGTLVTCLLPELDKVQNAPIAHPEGRSPVSRQQTARARRKRRRTKR